MELRIFVFPMTYPVPFLHAQSHSLRVPKRLETAFFSQNNLLGSPLPRQVKKCPHSRFILGLGGLAGTGDVLYVLALGNVYTFSEICEVGYPSLKQSLSSGSGL